MVLLALKGDVNDDPLHEIPRQAKTLWQKAKGSMIQSSLLLAIHARLLVFGTAGFLSVFEIRLDSHVLVVDTHSLVDLSA